MKVLRKALADGAYLLNVDARDMPAIVGRSLQNMVERGLLAEEKRDLIRNAILERERVISTAIGHAVAIPHAYLDELEDPLVIFVRLKHAVNLGAPDGIPTRFLFILAGPKAYASEHLDTLTVVARLMSDEQFRYDAAVALTKDDLIQSLDRFVVRTTAVSQEELTTVPEGLQYTGKPGQGLINDIKRRLPHYASDFKDGLHLKCLASVLFLFFACLAPSVTFGGLMSYETGGQIGVVEMLIATAFCGIVYALFSGQPLSMLGGTGPMLVFTVLLYQMCLGIWGEERGSVLFLPVLGWVGLWTALFVLLMSIFEACVLIRFFTRFTDEIFAALISIIFISEAVKNLFGYLSSAWNVNHQADHDKAFLSLILALGTFYVAMSLSRFRKSRYLQPRIREFLSDFGPTIAVFTLTVLAFSFSHVEVETLNVPEKFGPTLEGRNWLVDLGAVPLTLILGCAIPGVLVSTLVYLDQNITVRLVNSPDHKLLKGEGYHLDFLIVGLLIAVCSLFGFPWLVAATVRSLNHVRSLATTEEVVTPGSETREKVIHVRETRLTGLCIHLLIAFSMLLLPLMRTIPVSVLYGLFLFMGVVSIAGNQFFERLSLWWMDSALYPSAHYIRRVPIKSIHLFTIVQVSLLALLWVVKASPIGILFPLFIALLVPVRLWLPKIIPVEHVLALDMEEDPEHEESQWV